MPRRFTPELVLLCSTTLSRQKWTSLLQPKMDLTFAAANVLANQQSDLYTQSCSILAPTREKFIFYFLSWRIRFAFFPHEHSAKLNEKVYQKVFSPLACQWLLTAFKIFKSDPMLCALLILVKANFSVNF